ncbi:MAG: hypothetical protein AB1554_16400 [Chloroflexota bacterium]
MNQQMHQEQEKTIIEYPYRPFGWLIVTSKRLIFRKIPFWINTFTGIIQLSDIKSVELIKNRSLFAVPQLEFTHLDSTHRSVITTKIYLPGLATRIGIEMSKGVTPESLHETIVELLKPFRLLDKPVSQQGRDA